MNADSLTRWLIVLFSPPESSHLLVSEAVFGSGSVTFIGKLLSLVPLTARTTGSPRPEKPPVLIDQNACAIKGNKHQLSPGALSSSWIIKPLVIPVLQEKMFMLQQFLYTFFLGLMATSSSRNTQITHFEFKTSLLKGKKFPWDKLPMRHSNNLPFCDRGPWTQTLSVTHSGCLKLGCKLQVMVWVNLLGCVREVLQTVFNPTWNHVH